MKWSQRAIRHFQVSLDIIFETSNPGSGEVRCEIPKKKDLNIGTRDLGI